MNKTIGTFLWVFERFFTFRIYTAVVTFTLGLELTNPLVAKSPVMAVFPGYREIWIFILMACGLLRLVFTLYDGRKDTCRTQLMDSVFTVLWVYIAIFCYLNQGWILRQFGCAFSLPTAVVECIMLFRRLLNWKIP